MFQPLRSRVLGFRGEHGGPTISVSSIFHGKIPSWIFCGGLCQIVHRLVLVSGTVYGTVIWAKKTKKIKATSGHQ